MKQRALKPWHGVVFFAIVMLVFFVVCAPLQMYFGMYGVAMTEILLLIMALIFAKLMGFPCKILFPMRKPGGLPLFGVICIWLGAYLIDMVVMLIQYRLFPLESNAVNEGLNSVIYSVPFLVSVIITAVLPAICEEAVHRGVIIHTLYGIRREWLVVLIMGIYFGVFHTDPIRFLPTAILGAALSYIMLETENIIYPAFFHFVNNFFPLLLQGLLSLGSSDQLQDTASQSLEVPIVSIGLYMIFAVVSPFLLYLGNYLIHREKGVKLELFPKATRKKNILSIVIPSVALLVAGWLVMFVGILFDPVFKDMLSGI